MLLNGPSLLSPPLSLSFSWMVGRDLAAALAVGWDDASSPPFPLSSSVPLQHPKVAAGAQEEEEEDEEASFHAQCFDIVKSIKGKKNKEKVPNFYSLSPLRSADLSQTSLTLKKEKEEKRAGGPARKRRKEKKRKSLFFLFLPTSLGKIIFLQLL